MLRVQVIITLFWVGYEVMMFIALAWFSAMTPDSLGWGTVSLQPVFGFLRFGCCIAPQLHFAAISSVHVVVVVAPGWSLLLY